MFRLIVDINEINIDNIKLPPIPGIGMIKKLPNDQKFSMLISTINSQKEMFIPKMEEEIQKKWGYIHILDMQADMPLDQSCYIRLRLDIGDMDYDKAIDQFLPSVFNVNDTKSILGEAYQGPANIYDVLQYMHQAPSMSQKEFYFVKSLSSQKQLLIQNMELGASMQGAILRIGMLRFLIKQ